MYFPIYQGYVDGGMVANNPSSCALAEALHPDTGKQRLEDVVLISVGTGDSPRAIPSTNGDWGVAQWGLSLVYILFEGSSGLADFQCSQILAGRYRRVNMNLPHGIGLDDVSRIDALVELADTYSQSAGFLETVVWLQGRTWQG